MGVSIRREEGENERTAKVNVIEKATLVGAITPLPVHRLVDLPRDRHELLRLREHRQRQLELGQAVRVAHLEAEPAVRLLIGRLDQRDAQTARPKCVWAGAGRGGSDTVHSRSGVGILFPREWDA